MVLFTDRCNKQMKTIITVLLITLCNSGFGDYDCEVNAESVQGAP